MRQIKLILVLLLFSQVSFGISQCDLELMSSKEHLEIFIKRSDAISTELANLNKSPEAIANLKKFKQELEGMVNDGIYKVLKKNEKNELILKILPSNYTHQSYKYKILLQSHFADLGLSPKIDQIFFDKNIIELREMFPEKISEFSKLAILMEKLDEGILIKDLVVKSGRVNHEFYPKSLDFLSSDKIDEAIESIKKIEKVFNDLEVDTFDVQFHISKSGKVSLIDFDFYEWSADPLIRSDTFKPSDFSDTIKFLESFK